MAEGREGLIDSRSFRERFDDELTCSVCLAKYTDPKTLPCLHSFCLHCIERIPVEIKDGKYYISCPTCRANHLLPQGGANSLPNAFQINSFLDLRTAFEDSKPEGSKQESCTPHYHNNILSLTVYCETCCEVISQNSISTEHNEHTFHLISECYPKHHQQILDNLDLVKHKLDDMNTAMTHLDTREREVVEQGENVKEQINTHAQQLIDNIQQSRTHLTQQVDTIVQQKTQTLATQRQQAQKLHTQLKNCQDMIEHSLKEWNQQQILTQKIIMVNEMNAATQNVDPAVFQPIEDANIQLNKKELKEMGSVTRIAYSEAILEVRLPCQAHQISMATLTLHSQDGSPFSLPPSLELISSTLFSPGNKHSVECPITQIQPGKYNITFTPSTIDDQLIVQVGGVDVPGSPFTLQVTVMTPILKTSGKPIDHIPGWNIPLGIALCTNGDVVVPEMGAHSITILNNKGEKKKTFKQFNFPLGVAISIDGHILVTDCHRLQKLTTDGVCVKSVGSKGINGNGPLQFYYPKGIAVHPTLGQIFVADCDNNRIQVFSNDLTFSRTISPRTLSILPFYQFDHPRGVAIDDEGFLYIADNRKMFKVLGSSGSYIRKFDSAPNQKVINRPSSLTVHNNLVYVYDCDNNSILEFDTNGKFQQQLEGRTTLNYPDGISTDTFTLVNLYVKDTRYEKSINSK